MNGEKTTLEYLSDKYRLQIVAMLSAGPTTVADIVDRIGVITHSTTQKLVDMMVEEGRARLIEYGKATGSDYYELVTMRTRDEIVGMATVAEGESQKTENADYWHGVEEALHWVLGEQPSAFQIRMMLSAGP